MTMTDIKEPLELLIQTICLHGSNRVVYELAILLFDFLQNGLIKVSVPCKYALHFATLSYVSLLSLPPHSFVRPTCCYVL
jgi:hypothetical protein